MHEKPQNSALIFRKEKQGGVVGGGAHILETFIGPDVVVVVVILSPLLSS